MANTYHRLPSPPKGTANHAWGEYEDLKARDKAADLGNFRARLGQCVYCASQVCAPGEKWLPICRVCT
jgi:hypothetical protein